MFLGFFGTVVRVNEDELKRLGKLIETQRKRQYGTKSAAYKEAGLNAATWDRAEAGLPIREDRMTAVLRTLFGLGSTSPEVVLARADALVPPVNEARGPYLEEPSANVADLASWTAENFARINDALADLAEAIEEIKRKDGQEHGDSSAEKSDGGASVTQLTPRPDSSDLDETLDPAADDVRPDDDEEPGGSDDPV